MKKKIEFPIIIIDESKNVELYFNEKDANVAVEDWQITEGLFDAYDAKGRKLIFKRKNHAISIDTGSNDEVEKEKLISDLQFSLQYLQDNGLTRGVFNEVPNDLEKLIEIFKLVKTKFEQEKWHTLLENKLKRFIFSIMKK